MTDCFETYGQYRRAVSALADGRYAVVEGHVTDFVEKPKSESFMVDGVRFSYSPYVMTPGFNTPAWDGGPLREGMQVRISYVGNTILRLEVAR